MPFCLNILQIEIENEEYQSIWSPNYGSFIYQLLRVGNLSIFSLLVYFRVYELFFLDFVTTLLIFILKYYCLVYLWVSFYNQNDASPQLYTMQLIPIIGNKCSNWINPKWIWLNCFCISINYILIIPFLRKIFMDYFIELASVL